MTVFGRLINKRGKMSVTISGSFNRHMNYISAAVSGFDRAGLDVLSPKVPVLVDQVQDFLFVESDASRNPKLVQDGHLAAIRNSSFLWLVSPDGYVGPSAALEIGFAMAHDVPVLSATPMKDATLRYYVKFCPELDMAPGLIARMQRPSLLSRLTAWLKGWAPLAPVEA